MNSVNLVSDFDIVSFFVALAVAFYSFTKYSEQSLGNRAFKRLIFCSLILCAADFFSCLTLKANAGTFLELFFHSLYIFSALCFSQSILAYTNSYIYTKAEALKEKKKTVRALFPAVAVALAINAFTGFLFFIDDDFSITRGPAYAAIPIACAALALQSVIQLGRFAQKFNRLQIRVLCLFYETAIALPFVQDYLCPQVRVSPFVFVFFTTTLLLTLETPDDQALIATISELEELQRALKISVEKKTAEAMERREKLERLTFEMMHALSETIDAKDRYTSGHSARVARYSKMLAQKKGLSPEKCQQIFMMGLLHDIGKVGVSTEILNKPGRLTDQEFAQIKAHPAIGSTILEKVSLLPELRTGARWHHERIDGRGYPDGLSGEQIPLEAKIIAIADAYDAMTSSRSYRPPMEQAAVREQIATGIGSQFDKEIGTLMLELIDEDKRYILHEYRKRTDAQNTEAAN